MERIKSLRAVWLSHRHADHHVGLPLLLATRRELLPDAPAVPLFGPFPMRKVLSACNRIQDLGFAWHDQYSICPREQGHGRNLDFFWDRVSDSDAAPAVASVCQVRPPAAPSPLPLPRPARLCMPVLPQASL